VSVEREDWRVSVTRLICTLILSVGILTVCLWILLTRPEYNAAVGLLTGTVLGAWFGIIRPGGH
jgi:hypothetical protein